MPSRIPIAAAKRIAADHDLRQVILVARDGKTNALKRAVFEAAIASGPVRVTIVAHAETDLPEGLNVDGTALDYGMNLAKPIPDLETSADGISATLSFWGEQRLTFVPWGAVARLVLDGQMEVRWAISPSVPTVAPSAKPRLRVVP